jgi:hypothetical protein
LGQPVPVVLTKWEEKFFSASCDEYIRKFGGAELSEMNLDFAVFVRSEIGVTLAYAASIEQSMRRDVSRMRGFPDVKVSVKGACRKRQK